MRHFLKRGQPVEKIVYAPAHCVQQVVRWRMPTLFSGDEFYFDALDKGRELGFRIGIRDVNLNNAAELIIDRVLLALRSLK